jgi:hypothetical protein
MQKKNILIIRRGLFGDSIVAINALEYIRNKEDLNIQLHYLSDFHPKKDFLTSKDVLSHLNLIDNFYNFQSFSTIRGCINNFFLFLKLFKKYNKLIILECNYSSSSIFIKRSIKLGNFLGISQIVYDNCTTLHRDKSQVYIATNLLNFITNHYN